ncbi:MAG: hypothetical protein U1G07_18040 [Verrucomicrobiota bacterium]
MRRANIVKGRIEEHGQGLGEPNEALVQARAREIAVTNGRQPNQSTAADVAQAREELTAAQNGPDTSSAVSDEELLPFPDAAIGEGRSQMARTKTATDEQELPAELVQEGVEEANHEQSVEGNRASRRKDERFDDQLPSEVP